MRMCSRISTSQLVSRGSARHSATEGRVSLLLDGLERPKALIRAEPGGTVSPSLRGGSGGESERARAEKCCRRAKVRGPGGSLQ